MTTSLLDSTLSGNEAAKLLGVSVQWLAKLRHNGYVSQTADGRYDPCATVKGYARSLIEDKRSRTITSSAERLAAAKAHHAELKAQQLEGRLCPTDDMLDLVAVQVGAFMSRIGGVATAFTRDKAERARLQNMINNCRNAFADDLRPRIKKQDDAA
jgi:hypothetical protein